MNKRLISAMVTALLTTWAAHCHAESSLLVLGDSISAAYGIPVEEGWVALLDEHLNQDGVSYTVVNASISGETSGGGLARLPALLDKYQPDIVIIELGANDGLRGFPIDSLRENLLNMVGQSLSRGARVLLVGMHIPPNYGKKYTEAFHQSYIRVAREESVALVPFLMDGVAGREGMMQADGLHPSAAAQLTLLQNILPTLQALLVLPATHPG